MSLDRVRYQQVWRWHFYAGLWVIPFLVVLSLSGIVYLFKPQLDRVMYRELLFVKSDPASPSTTRDADQMLRTVVARFPDATVTRYLPPSAADRSAEFVLTRDDDSQLSAFVDPHSGGYLGVREDTKDLQALAKKVHGELLIGTLGDRLVELAACWTVVLIISGLYLAWPRAGGKFWGVWLPRLRSGGRTFWKDLHSVTGLYASIFILFFVLSGLPWTGFWGDQFSKVWNTFPSGTFANLPQSGALTQKLNEGSTQAVPWAAEKMPLPESAHASDSGAISLQRIVDLARSEDFGPGYTISLPTDPRGVYTISMFTGQPRLERTLHIDQYSGALLADIGYEQYGLVPKWVEYGISLHQGQLFGIANQLICLLICLSILGLCVSGTIMWWKRRPSRTLGAPPQVSDPRIWKTAFAILILAAIAFPLVGISMIVVVGLDRARSLLSRSA